MANENRRAFLLQAGVAVAGLGVFGGLPARASTGQPEPAGAKDQPGNPPAAQKRIRGLMLDAARLPESLDYYRRVIEFCAAWSLNTIQFRLTDDQGSALRFATVPDLVTHPDALSPDDMKRLVEFAGSHGIDVIPEVESFGHTGYITRSPKYAHLLDDDPHGGSDFTGVIPVLPETRELMEKLYCEVASIFPSVYMHGGCDEVNWGGSAASRKALETRSRTEIWGDYLNALYRTAAGLGKQFIVWGDFVLHKDPQILARLDKNVIVMDWNYWDTGAVAFHDAFLQIQKSGHRALGAPGLISYRWGPRPGSEQLHNIDAFAEAYLGAGDTSSLGVVLTNWVPTRYVQNSLWDGFAYAAVAFNDGPEAARLSALSRFVKRHYGAEWNEQWAEAFDLIYDATPGYGRTSISPLGLRMSVPWSSEEQLKETLKQAPVTANPFTRLRGLLVQLEPAVRQNSSDFQAFALSVECLEQCFWREAVVRAAAHHPQDAESARLLIQTIAGRDREIAEKLSNDWDKGRSPNSAAKAKVLVALQPKDELLCQWRQAAAYSSTLAPDRFQQLLKTTGS
jgi:hypothetical protein